MSEEESSELYSRGYGCCATRTSYSCNAKTRAAPSADFVFVAMTMTGGDVVLTIRRLLQHNGRRSDHTYDPTTMWPWHSSAATRASACLRLLQGHSSWPLLEPTFERARLCETHARWTLSNACEATISQTLAADSPGKRALFVMPAHVADTTNELIANLSIATLRLLHPLDGVLVVDNGSPRSNGTSNGYDSRHFFDALALSTRACGCHGAEHASCGALRVVRTEQPRREIGALALGVRHAAACSDPPTFIVLLQHTTGLKAEVPLQLLSARCPVTGLFFPLRRFDNRTFWYSGATSLEQLRAMTARGVDSSLARIAPGPDLLPWRGARHGAVVFRRDALATLEANGLLDDEIQRLTAAVPYKNAAWELLSGIYSAWLASLDLQQEGPAGSGTLSDSRCLVPVAWKLHGRV